MDDLYGNAWGESTATETKNTALSSPWNATASSSPEISLETTGTVLDVDSKPEWPPDAAAAPVPWTTDVDAPTKSPTLWAQPPVSNIWDSSSQQTPPRSPSPSSQSDTPTVPPSSSSTPSESTPDDQPDTSSTSQLPISGLSASHSLPTSPDPFGTFESGHQSVPFPREDERWGSSIPATYDVPDVPTSPWVNDIPRSLPVQAPQDDEWEAAKREKEQLNKKVPPEVLTNIIDKFHEFARDTWPDPQLPPDEDWMKGWRRGLDSVEGLETLINNVIPERELPPRVQFGKTDIAKQMSESLRSSKHMPITRLSPMSHFLSAKSTDWEAAVKNRSDAIPDDMPAGWRILEKKEESVSAMDTKAKKTGIFSFWGRRGSSSVTTTSPPVSEIKNALIPDFSNAASSSSLPPPPVAVATTLSRPRSQSPRPSVESNRAISIPEKPPITPPVTESTTAPTPISQATKSTSDPLDFSTPESAPSAVSRFLNRFSRPRTTATHLSTFSLSSDDIDFLSGSVPSAMDDLEEEDDVPLAQRKITMNNGGDSLLSTFSSTTSMPNDSSNSSLSEASKNVDDFASFFDAPVSSGSGVGAPKTSSVLTAGRPLSTAGVPFAPRQNSTLRTGVRCSTSQFSVTADKNAQSPFILPPPPSSRSQTPPAFPAVRMSSAAAQKAPAPFLIPPPPSSSRPVTPALPAPPRAVVELQTRPLSPPSYSSEPSNAFDDDEFSDFLSSEQGPPRSSYSGANSRIKSQFLARTMNMIGSRSFNSPVEPSETTSGLDDFDDFMSSPAGHVESSPPPPPPPEKIKYMKSTQPTAPPPQASRAANHSRTVSLLEAAATRKGQWPAPPSPLPTALDPPPMPAVTSNTSIALLLEADDPGPLSMKASGSHSSLVSPVGPSDTGSGLNFIGSSVGFGTMGKPPLSLSERNPPSVSTQSPQSLLDFGEFDSVIPAAQVQPSVVKKLGHTSAKGGGSGAGGLSAQDLSFFEGL